MDVVGDDERQTQVSRNRLEPDVDDLLLVDALVLHLEEEVAGTENVAIGRSRVQGLLLLFGANPCRDLSFETAAQSDKASRMLREQVLVDSRLVVEALRVA